MKLFSSWPKDGPDSKVSIMTAIALSVTLCMSSSVFRSSGFIYIGIMNTLDLSREEASWPLSLLSATVNFSGLISGPLCQMFSPRPILMIGTLCAVLGLVLSAFTQNVLQLTITMGLIYGFGEGIILTTANIFLTQHFVKYRAVAFGIVYGGCTMSSVIFPPLLLWLNGYMSFNWVIFTQGIILLTMFFCSLTVHEPKWIQDQKKESAGDKKSKFSPRTFCSMLSSPGYILLLISNITLQWSHDSFITTLVDCSMDKGLSLTESVNLLPLFSAADIVGRIALPILCDKQIIRRPTLMAISYYLAGSALIVLPFAHTYVMMLLVILFLGVFFGSGNVLFPCMVGDFVSLEYLPMAFGVLGGANGAFYFLKPPFFGYFRDHIKSYDGMFFVCAATMLVTAILWTGLLIFMTFRRQRSSSMMSKEEQRDLDACSVAASMAPAAVSEAVRRASFISAVSAHEYKTQTSTVGGAAVENMGYIAEENV